MDRKKINIPNGDIWENILTSKHVELTNSSNYFVSQYLDEALIELYERFMLHVVNSEPDTIIFGQPVCVTTNDEVYLGISNDIQKSNIAGFVFNDSIVSQDNGFIKTEGILTTSKSSWNLIIEDQDGSDGLQDGQSYYLSNLNPGKITINAPDQQGEFVVPLGRALTNTHFKIDIDPIIGL